MLCIFYRVLREERKSDDVVSPRTGVGSFLEWMLLRFSTLVRSSFFSHLWNEEREKSWKGSKVGIERRIKNRSHLPKSNLYPSFSLFPSDSHLLSILTHIKTRLPSHLEINSHKFFIELTKNTTNHVARRWYQKQWKPGRRRSKESYG